MNPQSTDKRLQDANILIPRVLVSGKTEVITYKKIGTNIYYGSVTVNINSLNAHDQFMVDAYMLYNSQYTKLNFAYFENNKQIAEPTEAMSFYLANNNSKLQIVFERYSRTNNEARTIYYNVYSTNITQEVVL